MSELHENLPEQEIITTPPSVVPLTQLLLAITMENRQTEAPVQTIEVVNSAAVKEVQKELANFGRLMPGNYLLRLCYGVVALFSLLTIGIRLVLEHGTISDPWNMLCMFVQTLGLLILTRICATHGQELRRRQQRQKLVARKAGVMTATGLNEGQRKDLLDGLELALTHLAEEKKGGTDERMLQRFIEWLVKIVNRKQAH